MMALMKSSNLRQLLQIRKEALKKLKNLSVMKNYTDSEYNYLILHVKIMFQLITLNSTEIEQGVTTSNFEITYPLTLSNSLFEIL